MITGIGSDIIEIARLEASVIAQPNFPKHVLSEAEYARYEFYTSPKRRHEFLAGRWAAKEAYYKARGTGIRHLRDLSALDITYDTNGRPLIASDRDDENIHVSISHSDHYAQAVVIIECE